MVTSARSIYRAAERQVSTDVNRHLRGVLHHLDVLARLAELDSPEEIDAEELQFHAVYDPERRYQHQCRAIANELAAICRIFDAPSEVVDHVHDGLDSGDDTIALEVNYGSHDTGIEVYRGNKHQEAEYSFSVGHGTSIGKSQYVHEVVDAYDDVRFDDRACMFVFTGGDTSLHVGYKSYDRPNEALLELATPTLFDRLLG